MARYNATPYTGEDDIRQGGYQEGVDTVLAYIESIPAYPKLVAELKWAIEEGII